MQFHSKMSKLTWSYFVYLSFSSGIFAVVSCIIKRGNGTYSEAEKHCLNESTSLLRWSDISSKEKIDEIRPLFRETKFAYLWIADCQNDHELGIRPTAEKCFYTLVDFRYSKPSCNQTECERELYILCKKKDRRTFHSSTSSRVQFKTPSIRSNRSKVSMGRPRSSTSSRLTNKPTVGNTFSQHSSTKRKHTNRIKGQHLKTTQIQSSGPSTDKVLEPKKESKDKKNKVHIEIALIGLAIVLAILLCVVAVLCKKYKTKKEEGMSRNLGTLGMDQRILNEDTETEAGAVCSKNTEYAEAVDGGIYSKAFSEQQYSSSPRDNGKEEPAYDHIASYYRNVASVLIESDTCRFNHSRSLAINENCYYNTPLKR